LRYKRYKRPGGDDSCRERPSDPNADPIALLLHAAFQNVGYAELLRDLAQIAGRTLEALRRRP